MTARRTLGVLAVAAALPVAAGCGGGDKRSGAADTQTQTVQKTTRVEVVKEAGGSQGFDAQGIYRRESPGVVTILSTGLRENGRTGAGQGSGFVVSGSGEIATNAHVVTSGQGKSIREASQVFVRFQDGNQVPAKVVGFDPFSDVALLRVATGGLTLRPLPLGSTRDLTVGSPVAAIGSPFGEEQSLSVGVISATDRSIDSLTGFATFGAIQTDAAINRGNSGGPLLNARGEVLGINSQIQTQSGDGSGVGFAVPADTVRRSLSQLRRDGHARYAYLGVSSLEIYPQLAARFNLPVKKGVWVQDVVKGGPAEGAGLRAGGSSQRFQEISYNTGGDIITAVDGKEIQVANDLSRDLEPHQPGQTVTLTVFRDGKRRQVDVKLGNRPLSSP